MPEALMVSDYIAAAMGRNMQIMTTMKKIMMTMMMTKILWWLLDLSSLNFIVHIFKRGKFIFSNAEILLTTLLRLFQISFSENRLHHRVYFLLQLGFLQNQLKMTFPMSEMSTKVIMGGGGKTGENNLSNIWIIFVYLNFKS